MYFSPTDFVILMVFRTTVGPKRSWTVEAKRVYGNLEYVFGLCVSNDPFEWALFMTTDWLANSNFGWI
jgi:hypothetical protein